MERKTCEFCGTEYNSDLSKCPVCGKSETSAVMSNEEPAPVKRKGGARVAPKGQKKAPRQGGSQRGWGIACAVLGVAVLGGLIFFLVSMGYLGKKDPAPVQPVQQVTEPDQNAQPEEPQQPEEVDLSCTALTLSQTGLVLDQEGGHVYLTAVPTPLDCPDDIVFASSDESVATVDQNGMITAVAPGQTEITVTCGDVTETCTVVCDFEVITPAEPEHPDDPQTPAEPETPVEPEVVEPSLSSVDFTLFRPGEETTLTVKNAPAGANITYVSSNSSVATVSGTGVVTAVGSGTATITVTVNGKALTCIARCNLGDTTENNGTTEATGNYTISSSDVTLFSVGEAFNLSLKDENGNAANVSWSSSNGAVCTVDASGRVSAAGSGTATVSATVGGKTYSCIVRCNF